jgi:formylglycine-generating enzyme required for sulfatase activity
LVGNAVAAAFFCIGCGGDNGVGGGNYDPNSIAMIYVDKGTFMMGCTAEQGDECLADENPEHSVTLREFYISKTEVTQGLWKAVMEENPSYFTGDNLPVENVSWSAVQAFIAALNAKTGKTYRLPTEAEWEYAARGGKKSNGYRYSGGNTIGNVAWYDQNSGAAGGKTHPVGTKTPNELGIYDMCGNVWEWVSDWYSPAYYSASSPEATNPTGPPSGINRVIRGGGFDGEATFLRNSRRRDVSPTFSYHNLGFRLALSP